MSATALTVLGATDPSVVLDGSVGSVTNPPSGSNKGIDWVGLIPIDFSVTVYVNGDQDLAVATSYAGTDSGLEIFVEGASSSGTGTSTALEVMNAVNADPVASKFVHGTLHAGNDGSGVITSTVDALSTEANGVAASYPTSATEPVVAGIASGTGADLVNGNTWANTGWEMLVVSSAVGRQTALLLTSTDGMTVKAFPAAQYNDGSQPPQFVMFGPFPLDVWGDSPVFLVASGHDGAEVSPIAVVGIPQNDYLPAVTGTVVFTLAPAFTNADNAAALEGQGVRVTGTFKDNTGTLADPSTVVFEQFTPLDSETVTYTYSPSSGSIKKVSTGVYYIDLDTTGGAGHWYLRWSSTGIVAAAEFTFKVKESGV